MNNLNNTGQQQVIHITDKDIAKIVLHPLRTQILRELRNEHTVKELAQRLGVQQTKLYYHIDLLEKARLVVVASSRMVGNLEERSYRALAKDYSVELDDTQTELWDEAEKSIAAAFPTAKAEMLASYREAVAQNKARLEAGLAPPEGSLTMTVKFAELKLDKEGQRAFTERLEALLLELHSDEGTDYSVFYALYPKEVKKHEGEA
jgi:Predicted transcriptional regulator